MISVSEIFSNTIQGEGPHVGLKTCFVRVAGCSSRCIWCDSSFTWNDKNAVKWEEQELGNHLVEYCEKTGVSNVVLTGGQPCLYDFSKVIEILHKNNITVDIETQGDLFPTWLNDCDLIVFSPKPPSSGMKNVYDVLENYIDSQNFNTKMCIKIPVFNDEDFEFSLKYYRLVEEKRSHGRNIEFYLSVGNTNTKEEGSIQERILYSYEELINKVNNSEMKRVFILPQVHTLVWGNKSGV